ncbi:MAG: 50S ribosomal protein L23 [Kiritimatiellaeota bacterium]|nr:50S ribosomal protein L23 [Kiritimatiellota bacterium]
MKEARSIIKRLLVTEKGTRLTEKLNQYLFVVATDANKVEIKRAVEKIFNVTVLKVNTMHRSGKKKRQRSMNFGRTADWKRAVVTLKTGDKIELAQ